MPELYKHQVKALKMMKNGCILCGGVGTGKSMTSLAYYMTDCGGIYTSSGDYYPPRKKDLKQLVIITTAKKRDENEWERELARWDLEKPPVIIDSWNNIKKYQKIFGGFFIFDEQRLVGSGAWVKAFLDISRKNHWILLSATPGDSWKDYIPVFIANGFYKNRHQFEWLHVEYDPYVKKFPKIRRYINTEVLEDHRKEIVIPMKYDKPAIAHHEDVLVGYDLDKYSKVWKERWDIFNNEPIKEVAGLYMALRRVTNSDKQRIDKTLDICKRNERVIIFYSFNYERDMLRKMCEENGLKKYEWNGDKHEHLPDDPLDSWVYLVQYWSACEGWECTTTNVMIFYSQQYSYKTLVQAAGRIDRLNTPYKELHYYHLKSLAPIDRVISKAIDRKEEFNEIDGLEELKNETE